MDTTKPTFRITDLEVTERPRERLMHLGAESLTIAELLAILLRVGTKGENAVQMGQRLLKELGGLHGIHKASFDEVRQQKGVGEAKAAQIKAAIELGRRLKTIEMDETPIINSPEIAAKHLLYELSGLSRETLWVLVLDVRNHLLVKERLYEGSVTSSQVRVGEVFKSAILRNASGIIVAHNHPSGDPQPSPDDISLTLALREAGKLLDITVIDHLVIGGGRWISMKERRLGYE